MVEKYKGLPEKGTDGSDYHCQYLNTSEREPICVTEYNSEISNGSSAHVVQLDDCTLAEPKWREEFHELVLEERSGRERLIYARQCRMKELFDFVKDLKEVQKLNYLQLRYVFDKLDSDMVPWPSVEPIQFLVKLRSDADMQA